MNAGETMLPLFSALMGRMWTHFFIHFAAGKNSVN
jgi:hypothetical protein